MLIYNTFTIHFRKMGMLGATLKLCSKDLKPFSVSFGIYFMAFGMFGYVLFGKTLEKYAGFAGTLEALFAFSLGDYDFDEFVVSFVVQKMKQFSVDVSWLGLDSGTIPALSSNQLIS